MSIIFGTGFEGGKQIRTQSQRDKLTTNVHSTHGIQHTTIEGVQQGPEGSVMLPFYGIHYEKNNNELTTYPKST